MEDRTYLMLVQDVLDREPRTEEEVARLAFANALRVLMDRGRQWLMVLDPPAPPASSVRRSA